MSPKKLRNPDLGRKTKENPIKTAIPYYSPMKVKAFMILIIS